jgi:ubiquinone/menaquinone biosynthesis C-methylase UbiE
VINRAFPPWFSWFLESKLRLLVLAPDALVARLPLAPDFAVAEIGSGTGVYARVVRHHVRLLVAVELQWPLIAKAGVRDPALQQAQGSALTMPLRTASFDLIYLVTVFGELVHASEALAEIRRVLRPGGFLSISEHLPDPDYRSRAALRRSCEAAGFELLRSVGPWWNYTSTFRRPPG